MATTFNSILSFLKDVAPGIFGTYGTPAAPAIGDTDWSGVDATGAAVNEAFNMTDGQIIIGKTGVAAIANPSVAPVLTAGTSGTLLAGTYEVARTWPNAYGETQISPIASITFGSGTTNSISVAAVTPPAGITSVNTYMSDAAGSITLRFKTSNAGGSFTITSLPTGGAIVPPSSNTTASSNHPVKGALTGSNGIAITNGPGTVAAALAVTGDISASGGVVNVAKINGVAVTGTPSVGYVPTATSSSAATWQAPAGGTTIASGTSLPGSPASGDLFIRTDLKTINRFNGSTWDVIGFTNALTSAHINVGNGSNIATDVAMSGDATIANTGAVTVSKINGVSVSGTPSTGQVPTATGTTTATWQTPSGGGGGGTFIGVNVFRTTSQSIPNNVETLVNFDNEAFDSDAFHDNTTNNTRFTVPTGKAGKYIVSACIGYTANATGIRVAHVIKNGTTKIGASAIVSATSSGSAATLVNVVSIVSLAVADYVEVIAYQNSGGSLNVEYNASYPPTFEMGYLGA